MTRVSEGCKRNVHPLGNLGSPGETESGSAGKQPDKGYPGRGCAEGASGLRWATLAGGHLWSPLGHPSDACENPAAQPRLPLRLGRILFQFTMMRTLFPDEPLFRPRRSWNARAMPQKIRSLGHQATQNPEYPKNVGNDEGVSPRKMGECTRKPRRGDRADTDAVCVAPPGLNWRCSLATWGSRPPGYSLLSLRDLCRYQ